MQKHAARWPRCHWRLQASIECTGVPLTQNW
jgi:hypothetical protein